MTDADVAYWSSAIAPSPRQTKRFPPAKLKDVVEAASVALRGWNYPHVPRNPQDILGLQDGGIEGRVDWARYKEVWRFHPDGMFTHRWRMREDDTGFRGTIHLVSAIYTGAEVFEFGRRLYRDDESVDEVIFKVDLEGVFDRPGSGDSFEDLPYGTRARRNVANYSTTVPRADLAAGVLEPAVDATSNLFAQLGFSGVSRGFITRKTQSFLEGKI